MRRFIPSLPGFFLIFFIRDKFCNSQPAPLSPGFTTQLSKKGIDFLSQYSSDKLRQFLESGKRYQLQGLIEPGFEFELENARIKKFATSYESKIYVRSDFGLEWRITEMTIDMLSDYKATLNSVSSAGAFLIKFYRMGAIIKINVDQDKRGLRPVVSDCQAYIGLVEVDSSNKLIQKGILSFKRNLNPPAKSFFRKKLCEIIQENLVPKVTDRIFHVPRAAHLFKNYYVNYELVDSPVFYKDLIEMKHNGETFALARSRLRKTVILNSTSYHYDISQLEAPVNSDRMQYYYLSDYTISSLLYWMHRFGRFNYKFDKEKVGPEFSEYLKTECGPNDLCAGSLFPTLRKRFPGSYAEVYVKALRPPEIVILKGKIKMPTVGQIDGYARSADGQLTKFITGKIKLNWTFTEMTFVNNTLNGELQFESYELFDIKTDVKEFDKPSLSFLVDVTLDTSVKSDVAHVLRDGIKLPKIFDFPTINEHVEFLKGGIIAVSSDFCREGFCPAIPVSTAEKSERTQLEEKPLTHVEPSEDFYDYGSFL